MPSESTSYAVATVGVRSKPALRQFSVSNAFATRPEDELHALLACEAQLPLVELRGTFLADVFECDSGLNEAFETLSPHAFLCRVVSSRAAVTRLAKAAAKRQPRDTRPGIGQRKAAGTSKSTKKQTTKKQTTSSTTRSLTKKPSLSQSDADAAELLMGLGATRKPLNTIVDRVLGVTPEESVLLDMDEFEAQLLQDNGKNKDDEFEEFEGSTHDDDDDDEDYSITFVVPCRNATRDLVLPCTTAFGEFLTALALKMEVSVTHLAAIGYKASFWPKTPKPLPKLLESEEDYERLMEEITEYRKGCLKKRGGTVKPFSITDPVDARGSGSKASKKKEQPAAPLKATEQQEHKLMEMIEKHHACQEHVGKACYVTGSGEHYQYTNNDLVIWVTLMRRNLATVDKVPDQLKIEDQLDRQRKAKKALQVSQSVNNTFNGGGASWQMQMMPPWMYMPPPWMMQGPPAAAAAPAKTPSPPRKRKYPAIRDWLEELDSDEDRGGDMQDYGQYAGVLSDIGIIRLDDLIDVGSPEKLRELTGMNWGTAKRLIKFAQEDIKTKKTRTE
ncbi:hypothetical protein DFH09DRAFT_1317074 [Mycena vulgaris]|nr:hypothetical protein DFH09DRAFT_1317074 [Mycena vulgaris]